MHGLYFVFLQSELIQEKPWNYIKKKKQFRIVCLKQHHFPNLELLKLVAVKKKFQKS